MTDGTYDGTLHAVDPPGGYAVGVRSMPSVRDAVRRVREGQYVGVWTDRTTGLVYVDLVAIIPRRDVALALAARRGEIAVWDFARGNEVRIAG